MRQRNDTGYVQHVMAWPGEDGDGPGPFTVGPGEVVDHPEPLAGFTDLSPAPVPETAKPARKSAAPTPAATDEGGEPA